MAIERRGFSCECPGTERGGSLWTRSVLAQIFKTKKAHINVDLQGRLTVHDNDDDVVLCVLVHRYMFWLSAPFLVSEREPHCVLERGLQFTKALRGLLEPRGWTEVSVEIRVGVPCNPVGAVPICIATSLWD